MSDSNQDSILCKCQEKILIVDDSSFNLMPLRTILKRQTFNFEIIEQYNEVVKIHEL